MLVAECAPVGDWETPRTTTLGCPQFCGFYFQDPHRFLLWRAEKYSLGALTDGREEQYLWNKSKDQGEKYYQYLVLGKIELHQDGKGKKGMLWTVCINNFDLS